MRFLIALVGDLSWSLKAAWIVWGAWVAIQIVWRRRARVEVSQHEASPRDWLPERSTLGLAPRPERTRVLAASPVPQLSVALAPTPALPASPAIMSEGRDTVEALASSLSEPAPEAKRSWSWRRCRLPPQAEIRCSANGTRPERW